MTTETTDSGALTTRRPAETIAEWFDANGGYDARHRPGEWKIRAQQKLWEMDPGLVGDAAGLQWAAVIDVIAPIVESALREDAYARNCRSAYRLVQDLDRCRHGRHEGDRCFDCPGGESIGNDLIRPGLVVGHDHGGEPLAMPERGKRHLREEWLRAGALAATEAENRG